ncbi:MAG: hypothetical protein IPP79_01735 [Chitinophagaceae bacterium]|nr:hypothetical protein [Chitinophagaceae bacterium]
MHRKNTQIKLLESKGYSLLWGGIETSTTSVIDTKTKDSSRVNLYLAPYIDYNHKSGFGLRVKTYALPGGSNPGFYLTSISPYFAKYDGKVYPYISFTRYIQHDNPSVPYSPIQNEIYAHVRLKTKYIDPMAGIDIGFGNDEQNNNESVSDVNAYVAVNHLYLKQNLGVKKNNILGIRPCLQLNAGTDRYYKFFRTTNYISQNTKANHIGYGRGGSTSGNGTPVLANAYTISVENDFNLSNVEMNLYLMYFFGKFSIEPSGSLYFPLRGDDKTAYGYWQINLNYWLK